MSRATRNRWFFWGWFTLSSLFYSWILLGTYGDLVGNLAVRLVILAFPVAISLIFIRNIWVDVNLWVAFFITLIGYSTVYKIAGFLPYINSFPFTLTWSEGTAYYFASLFFSEKIYGVKANLPIINPTRHMLLAIPFLVSDLPIWFHRLWELILWLVISGLAIALMGRRFGIRDNLVRWAFSAWVFLYLFQGPVYYFLLLSLFPVLWGFEAKNFRKTLLLVLIGSVWAGASRVNWIPVPALLAATLYFLEEKVGDGHWPRYLLKPGIWLASGMIVALIAWYGYAVWSGNTVGDFGIYFTSNLLW